MFILFTGLSGETSIQHHTDLPAKIFLLSRGYQEYYQGTLEECQEKELEIIETLINAF
jgi:hypothetical protein